MAMPASAASMGYGDTLLTLIITVLAVVALLLSILLTSIAAERSRRKRYVGIVSIALAPSLMVIVALFWRTAVTTHVSDDEFNVAATLIVLLAGVVAFFAIIRSHTDD